MRPTFLAAGALAATLGSTAAMAEDPTQESRFPWTNNTCSCQLDNSIPMMDDVVSARMKDFMGNSSILRFYKTTDENGVPSETVKIEAFEKCHTYLDRLEKVRFCKADVEDGAEEDSAEDDTSEES